MLSQYPILSRFIHATSLPLVLIILLLPAFQPFLRGTLPATDDGLLHLYRIVNLVYSASADGTIYPRFASGLVYGYGSPLFNYFPPVSYYPALALYSLGLSAVQAWLTSMILYLGLAAWGAYRLGALWGGPTTGLLTALAYVYGPYVLFNAVARGTLIEIAGLAGLPWVFWAFAWLAQHITPGRFALATGLYALFIPLHNVVTLHGTLLLMPYCLALMFSQRRRQYTSLIPVTANDNTAENKSLKAEIWRTGLVLVLAGCAALALTAFAWVPALTETSAVRIDAITRDLPFVDVTRTLRPLTEILAPPRTADPTQLQAPIPISLSWPALFLACIAVPWLWRRRNISRIMLACLTLTCIVLILMGTPIAAGLWRTIPLIGYTQFAWRILGPATLLLALLAGLGGALLIQRIASGTRQNALCAFFCIIIVVYAMPWLYARYSDIAATRITDAQDYERQSGELSLSSYSEYLPSTSETAPDPERLRQAFEAGGSIARLQDDPAVTVNSADWQGTSARLQIAVSETTTLIFNWLYVPGWQARLADVGLALTVRPASPEGLVSIAIPAGQHDLIVALEPTPMQVLATQISQITLLTVSSLTVAAEFARRRRRALTPKGNQAASPRSADTRPGFRPSLRVLAAVGMGLFVLKLAIIDQTQNPIRHERFRDGISAGVDLPINARFSAEITLLGLSGTNALQSGSEGVFSLFWALADAPVDRDYSSLLWLVDAQDNIIAETSAFQPGQRATSNWVPSAYLEDRLALQIPPGTPPGVYALRATLYDSQTLERLSVINEMGNPERPYASLGAILITRPSALAPAPQVADAQASPLHLMGGDPLPVTARTGDPLQLTWTWWAAQTPDSDYTARLIWQAGDTEMAGPALPLVSQFPTSQWLAGEQWTGRHVIYVPASLPPGEAGIAIELLLGDKVVRRWQAIAVLLITVPERAYNRPVIQQDKLAQWVDGPILRGYSLGPDGQSLELIWQTNTLMSQSLHLFVHVLDGEQIVAQSDGIPADWTRPTTGWNQEEYVTTRHAFGHDLRGQRIRIGWYNPRTEARILLTDDADALVLEIAP